MKRFKGKRLYFNIHCRILQKTLMMAFIKAINPNLVGGGE